MLVLSLAGPAVRVSLHLSREERSVSCELVFDSQTYSGLIYKPETSLLSNSRADIFRSQCVPSSLPYLFKMLFLRHLGNHPKNPKVASQTALIQQRQEDGPKRPFTLAKMPLSWTGLDDPCIFLSFHNSKLPASLVFSFVKPLELVSGRDCIWSRLCLSWKVVYSATSKMSLVFSESLNLLHCFGYLFFNGESEGWDYC